MKRIRLRQEFASLTKLTKQYVETIKREQERLNNIKEYEVKELSKDA